MNSAVCEQQSFLTMSLRCIIRSGLPIRNGIRHAVEVTNCAMDLLSQVTQFKVQHVPDYVLQIRIGQSVP